MSGTLKILQLRKKESIKSEELKTKDEQIRNKEEEIKTLETELETIDKIESLKEFEERSALVAEELNTMKEERAQLLKELEEVRNEIKETEEKTPKPKQEETKEERNMGNDLITRNEVREFLTDVRTLEKRGVKGANLAIPSVLIDTIRKEIHNYSKLIKLVDVRPVRGEGRVNVIGEIPEAVWAEACATVKELEMKLTTVRLDQYEVAGYIPICQAILEEATDLELLEEIKRVLGQAIGKAIDKAILFGKGKKMPLGIITRLAQDTDPDDGVEWENIKATHVGKVSISAGSGKGPSDAIAKLVTALADVEPFTGERFYVMNHKTYAKMQSSYLAYNLAGEVTTGLNFKTPLIGGEIVILPFMPDDCVLFGYPKAYLLAEHQGIKISTSEHVRFLEGHLVAKGVARYDGRPIAPKAFKYLSISATEPTTELTFQE